MSLWTSAASASRPDPQLCQKPQNFRSQRWKFWLLAQQVLNTDKMIFEYRQKIVRQLTKMWAYIGFSKSFRRLSPPMYPLPEHSAERLLRIPLTRGFLRPYEHWSPAGGFDSARRRSFGDLSPSDEFNGVCPHRARWCIAAPRQGLHVGSEVDSCVDLHSQRFYVQAPIQRPRSSTPYKSESKALWPITCS